MTRVLILGGTGMLGQMLCAVLGRDPMLMISPAPDALYQALEGGQPVVAGQPNIPIAKQMRQLALMLYDSI